MPDTLIDIRTAPADGTVRCARCGRYIRAGHARWRAVVRDGEGTVRTRFYGVGCLPHEAAGRVLCRELDDLARTLTFHGIDPEEWPELERHTARWRRRWAERRRSHG